MTFSSFFRTGARVGVSVLCMGCLLFAGPSGVAAQNATQPAVPVTDDLVSGEAPSAPESPAPVPEIPLPEPGKPFVLDPNIDYGLPDAPAIPVAPGTTVINPAEAYMPEDEVVVMPATPGTPEGANATLNGAINGAINGTLTPLEPPVNGSSILPLMNGTLPQINGTMPQVNGTMPQMNATLPQINGTMPQTNGTRLQLNGTLPQSNATLNTPPLNNTVVVPQSNATQSMRILTPADFLVKTPDKAQKDEPQKAESKKDPVKQVASNEKPAKKEPVKKDDKKPEPPKKDEKKPESPKKTENKPATPQKRGEDLRIPPEAAQNGDLRFLEGCWRGTRPEYHSKRIVNERFCFDERGVGKRTIVDPAKAGMCYGPTKAVLNKDGVLRMVSGQAACTSGLTWGSANMICKGEGNQTPCYWQFPDVNGSASQSYKIRFVRE